MRDRSNQGSLGRKPSAYRTCKDEKLLSLIPKDDDRYPKIMSCDTEDNQKGRTYMVNLFDGFNHFTFRNTEAALEWTIEYSRKYKKGVEIWIANLGYDIGNIFRESQENLSVTLAGSRFIVGKIYQERVKFKDILNVIPGASVKKLGDMIGMKKIETNDFDNEEYCQRDTEIVYWSLLYYKNTLSKLNIELKNTAAATGFNALLKQYPLMSVNNLTEEDHEFMKRGYYGGRTEVFNTGKHNNDIFGYDIISCYPSAMREIPVVDTTTKIYTKKPNIKEREGFCDCIIEAPGELRVPYLPVKFEDKLIFPRGKFRGVWTYFEIREAIKLGYKIRKNFRSIEFKNKYDFVLSEFIERLFKTRAGAKLANDVVLDYACKIILNASYGKLAMGNEKQELVAFDNFHSIKGNYSSEIYPNNQIMIKKDDKHAPSTNFLTAALITAYGRHKLYQFLIEADKNGILLYCDTDSIFLKGPKFNNLPKIPGLGDLEFQYEISEARFVLPKTYYLKFKNGTEIYKCKGVWGDLAKQYFTKGFVEKMQPLKYIETCRKNLYIQARNKKNKQLEQYLPFNLWVNKIKAQKSDYNKRIVNKDGTTQPIKLNYCIESMENTI